MKILGSQENLGIDGRYLFRDANSAAMICRWRGPRKHRHRFQSRSKTYSMAGLAAWALRRQFEKADRALARIKVPIWIMATFPAIQGAAIRPH